MKIAVLCVVGALAVLATGIGAGVLPTGRMDGSAAAAREASVRQPSRTLLSDRAAAQRVRRSDREPRKGNRKANQRIPTTAELERFRRASMGQGVAGRVTGRFRGTTGEIIEWAALKWGLDPNLLKAQAMAESSWRQDKVGDGGRSFGLMQVKRTIWRGSHPLSRLSTAFNVDLAGAILRQAYDGHATWYRDDGYRAGDLWGSVGSYFSGAWRDAAGRRYVERVRRHLAERPWTEPGF